MDGAAKLDAAAIFGFAGVFSAMAAFVSGQSRVAGRNGFNDNHLQGDISGDEIGSIQAMTDSLLFTKCSFHFLRIGDHMNHVGGELASDFCMPGSPSEMGRKDALSQSL